MNKPKNMIGEHYGRLEVISLCNETTTGGRRLWLCKCECGNFTKATRSHLINGGAKSCGCMRKECSEKLAASQRKHGMFGKRIYTIWQQMKDRCYNQNNNGYKDYGGRGIKVCNEWHNSTNFFEWALANGYNDNLTIDRIDVNGNYEPSNCRWVTMKVQDRNRRNTIFITFNGETKSLAEWCEIRGLPYGRTQKRYYKGYPPEIVLAKESFESGKRITNINK
jgi:hypothetical protein